MADALSGGGGERTWMTVVEAQRKCRFSVTASGGRQDGEVKDPPPKSQVSRGRRGLVSPQGLSSQGKEPLPGWLGAGGGR